MGVFDERLRHEKKELRKPPLRPRLANPRHDPIRVHTPGPYRECDPMGVVYHTHYLDYFEASRTEALRELGVVYKSLEDQGVRMPVIEASIRYKQPAFYDDLLEITSEIVEPPRTRIQILNQVRRAGEDDVLVSGKVTLCFIDEARNRPIVAPPSIVELFKDVP